MKENTKKYIKLSIILYVVILSVALIGTLAWFIFEKSATISTEEESKIIAGEYLEICWNDGTDNWVTDMKFDEVVQHPDVSLTPDGDVWYPVSLDENDQLFVGDEGKNGVYRNVTNLDGYFIKLDLKVRASRGLNVYLNNESFVRGVDMTKTDANIKIDEDNEVSFSKDAVAGAARVAFFDESGVKMLWVPNETYELVFDETTGKPINFIENGAPESEYKYLKVTADGTVAAGDEYGKWEDEGDIISCGDNVLASTDGVTPLVNDAKPILSFTSAGEKELTIYIWVEGSDREANTILSGGALQYNLKFVGIEQKAEANVDINDVAYRAGKLVYQSTETEVGSEILYSNDSIIWSPYSANVPDLAVGKNVLYVRSRETATELAGEIKEISIQ